MRLVVALEDASVRFALHAHGISTDTVDRQETGVPDDALDLHEYHLELRASACAGEPSGVQSGG